MRYTDSSMGSNLPRLFLGQVVGSGNNSHDIQWQLRSGDTVVDEGVARTIRVPLEDIDVEADGQANNVILSGSRQYLVLKGFKPDTTGLGSIKS